MIRIDGDYEGYINVAEGVVIPLSHIIVIDDETYIVMASTWVHDHDRYKQVVTVEVLDCSH